MNNILSFSIPLNPVTKKNHGQIILCKGHPIMLPSKPYIEYEKACKPFMPTLNHPIDYPINLKCTFFMKSKRKVDLSNLISAISDILSKYNVILDDNRNIIASYDGSLVLYDKDNPRTIIEISPKHDYLSW